MATRWYNLQETLAEVAIDGEFGEFDYTTDESETESESESENSENSADEASNFVNQEPIKNRGAMILVCIFIVFIFGNRVPCFFVIIMFESLGIMFWFSFAMFGTLSRETLRTIGLHNIAEYAVF